MERISNIMSKCHGVVTEKLTFFFFFFKMQKKLKTCRNLKDYMHVTTMPQSLHNFIHVTNFIQ